MTWQPNDGERASALELGALAAGELDADAEAALRERAPAQVEAWLQGVARSRAELPSFDAGSLRARARQLEGAAPARPANNTRAFALLAALAAALLLWLQPWAPAGPGAAVVDPSYVGVRGAASLQVYRLDRGRLVPYDGEAMGQGDVLGFRVLSPNEDAVTVMSIDGTGAVALHWPEQIDAPEAIPPGREVALPGTLLLDDAPGPEVFVAVFGGDVSAALAAVTGAAAGGPQRLLDWAERRGDVAAAVVQRR